MDISEALSLCRFLLPLAASRIAFRAAARIDAGRLRFATRAASSALMVASAAVALFASAVWVACSRSARPVYSPDHCHVAVLTYALQGALGDDYATVAVRSRWAPWATEAYSGLGPWDFKKDQPLYPQIRWLDSSRLLIRHSDERAGVRGRGRPPICRDRIGAVEIVCERAAGNPE